MENEEIDLIEVMAKLWHRKRTIMYIALFFLVGGLVLAFFLPRKYTAQCNTSPDCTEVGIEIHSGKNRIVRRIFEHFGYQIIKLDRVYFAGITKKNLPRGTWRFLTPKEVTMLKVY